MRTGLLDKEALLSYAVIMFWLRQAKVLVISSSTGAFVYMLVMMLQDVLRWLVIYGFGSVAFSAGLYVLFRNQRAALGLSHNGLGEECAELSSALHSWLERYQQ